MQNIKVKEINSKSGTNKKGQWTSFIVVAEDGAEFTSFDTKLSGVKSGSILSVELEVKGKYTNIKDFESALPLAKFTIENLNGFIKDIERHTRYL